ncbi:hypothetical protein HZS61_005381 [Fusarium oxysporum f. sp. conglutinans]|uniref:Uncharacterized protein n=1 Tax=Fusarium oxysporum f. sp. conglutinans TaxID=100902 RepID=A0A8H6GDP0_FUSOX|nr:hypothetical protein HZS61_005381 [Fusarium oxysporum f. sp. conglutinans]
MASSSPISSTSAQLTAIERLGWDFYSFFRVEYPEKNKTQIGRVQWIDFNPKRRRIRCIGHIINLSLQSFLLARSKEALTAALNATISDESVDMVDHFAATLAETITQQEEPVLQARMGTTQFNST